MRVELPSLNWVSQVFRRLGSFWYSLFTSAKQVRILIKLNGQTSATGQFKSLLNNLAGFYDQARYVEHQFLEFKSDQVIETGMQTYDTFTKSHTFQTEQDSETAYGLYRIHYFALPLGRVIPVTIQSATGKLILGTNFFIQAGSYIYFRDDPRLLFPDHKIVIPLGIKRDLKALNTFFARNNITEDDTYLLTFLKRYQTPSYFLLAAASVGGLKILNAEQRLLSATPTLKSTTYVFENQTLRVDYFHEPLVVGQVYPKHTIIGDGIKVLQSDQTARAWWREVDWRGGLSLDPFSQVKGLHLRDEETIAYSAGSDEDSVAGSKLHAQVKLGDDFWKEKVYWDKVVARETSQGVYFNGMINLPEDAAEPDSASMDTYEQLLELTEQANVINQLIGADPEDPDVRSIANSQLVNALDVFFQSVFSSRGFVILVDQNKVPRAKAVFNFIHQEMLAGCVPIVFSYGPDLPIETISLNGNMAIDESVSVQHTDVVVTSEEVGLEALISESVVIRTDVLV